MKQANEYIHHELRLFTNTLRRFKSRLNIEIIIRNYRHT